MVDPLAALGIGAEFLESPVSLLPPGSGAYAEPPGVSFGQVTEVRGPHGLSTGWIERSASLSKEYTPNIDQEIAQLNSVRTPT